MFRSLLWASFLLCWCALPATAQETRADIDADFQRKDPLELEVLAHAVGTWDADFEVWAAGPESPPMTFSGVETNRAFGKYWIASDLESEVMGQTIRVHSIVGYDLDRQQLVGTIIDHGPYAATMTGEYDAPNQTVRWTTHAKDPSGSAMTQHTEVRQVGPDERVLVLKVPSGEGGEVRDFMRIRYARRSQ